MICLGMREKIRELEPARSRRWEPGGLDPLVQSEAGVRRSSESAYPRGKGNCTEREEGGAVGVRVARDREMHREEESSRRRTHTARAGETASVPLPMAPCLHFPRGPAVLWFALCPGAFIAPLSPHSKCRVPFVSL